MIRGYKLSRRRGRRPPWSAVSDGSWWQLEEYKGDWRAKMHKGDRGMVVFVLYVY